MNRTPEPELMLGQEQARAYFEADFEEPHSRFIELFARSFPGEAAAGNVLDLGCGPADISLRFARAYPQARIDGVDGSETMLSFVKEAVCREGFEERIQLIHCTLPTRELPQKSYDGVISNSLLHHLQDPQVLWQTIKKFARPEAPVFVMDLMRPASEAQAQEWVATYAATAAEVVKHDFYHSLLAAYRPDEVRSQLVEAGLTHFCLEVIKDRYMVVWGKVGGPAG
jgi:ubiquinone/menaquinone biosynthesis C-methylase UbiE